MQNSIVRIGGNARMSAAVVHGGVAYLAGQVAIGNYGGSVDTQAAEVLERIDALLAEAGSNRSRLLTATLYVADLSTLPAINEAWDRWLPSGCAPARTTMQVVLASPAYALEIAVTAALAD